MSASGQQPGTDSSAGAGTGTVNLETGAGAAVEPEQATVSAAASPATLVARLEEIKARVMPILQSIRTEYTGRTRSGYPTIVDNVPHGGVFGLSLDPGWAVYFMTDGTSLFAELHETSLRTDTLSMANVEKFSGAPQIDRRAIDETWGDSDFRNLVSELLHLWNFQQLRIFRVDS
ncbi:MAG: hypothetical protein M3439_11470 [Chloroflexota bacterium]|nr:hypothetical protein [Chloroflexota bacterium]